MSDVGEFLQGYNEMLGQSASRQMPPELLRYFAIECSLAQTDTKELYIVRRHADGVRGLLRVSKNGAHEDAGDEANILFALNHPAIPKVLGFWQLPGSGFLVREYFEGRTLSQLVAEGGPLPAQDILGIARKLAAILLYLHGQYPPVVHRDLKPQNIILATDGSLKLIDFGIARSYQQDNQHDTVYLGTRPYAPPEQFGYAQTSPLSDIYALGIVLLYLATASTERQGLETKIKDKRLRGIIMGCIAFDPADRFGGAQQVLDALKKAQRHRGQWIGLCAGALALVVLAATLGYVFGREQPDLAGGASQSSPESGSQGGTPDSSVPDGSGAGSSASLPQGTSAVTPAPPVTVWPGELPFEGNWRGNITNNGFAVGTEKAIYFSDGSAIWHMAEDTQPAVLLEVRDATGLNLYDGALYYATGSGIFKLQLSTGHAAKLSDASAENLVISGGMLYFKDRRDSLYLHRMGLDGSGDVRMNTLDVRYLNVVGEQIYFADRANENKLCRANADGSGLEVLDERDCAWLSWLDGTLYFSIFSSPGGIDGLLTDTGEVAPVCDSVASYTNATPAGIFFIDGGAGSRLTAVSADGRTVTRLSEGRCGNICVAGGWVFYENEDGDEGGRLWRVRPDGTNNQPATPDT